MRSVAASPILQASLQTNWPWPWVLMFPIVCHWTRVLTCSKMYLYVACSCCGHIMRQPCHVTIMTMLRMSLWRRTTPDTRDNTWHPPQGQEEVEGAHSAQIAFNWSSDCVPDISHPHPIHPANCGDFNAPGVTLADFTWRKKACVSSDVGWFVAPVWVWLVIVTYNGGSDSIWSAWADRWLQSRLNYQISIFSSHWSWLWGLIVNFNSLQVTRLPTGAAPEQMI